MHHLKTYTVWIDWAGTFRRSQARTVTVSGYTDRQALIAATRMLASNERIVGAEHVGCKPDDEAPVWNRQLGWVR